MARKKKPEAHVNHERWLVSYADFITLLFAFFTALYAISTVDLRKLKAMSRSVRVAFEQGTGTAGGGVAMPTGGDSPDKDGGAGTEALDLAGDPGLRKLAAQFERLITEEELKNRVKLRIEPRGLVLSLSDTAFFDSGSEGLRRDAIPVFRRIGEELRGKDNRIRIEGHTDDRPIRGSRFKSNWELSGARAATIVLLLARDFAVPADRLSIAGYAEFHPVAPNGTVAGRRANRRVDIVLLVDPKDEPPPESEVAGDHGATQPAGHAAAGGASPGNGHGGASASGVIEAPVLGGSGVIANGVTEAISPGAGSEGRAPAAGQAASGRGGH